MYTVLWMENKNGRLENKLVYHFFLYTDFPKKMGSKLLKALNLPQFSVQVLYISQCEKWEITDVGQVVMIMWCFTVAVRCRAWLCAFVASAKDYCSITILLIQLLMLTRGCDSHKTFSAMLRCKIKKHTGCWQAQTLENRKRHQSYVILRLEPDCFTVGCCKDIGNICMLADCAINRLPAMAGAAAPGHCAP